MNYDPAIQPTHTTHPLFTDIRDIDPGLLVLAVSLMNMDSVHSSARSSLRRDENLIQTLGKLAPLVGKVAAARDKIVQQELQATDKQLESLAEFDSRYVDNTTINETDNQRFQQQNQWAAARGIALEDATQVIQEVIQEQIQVEEEFQAEVEVPFEVPEEESGGEEPIGETPVGNENETPTSPENTGSSQEAGQPTTTPGEGQQNAEANHAAAENGAVPVDPSVAETVAALTEAVSDSVPENAVVRQSDAAPVPVPSDPTETLGAAAAAANKAAENLARLSESSDKPAKNNSESVATIVSQQAAKTVDEAVSEAGVAKAGTEASKNAGEKKVESEVVEKPKTKTVIKIIRKMVTKTVERTISRLVANTDAIKRNQQELNDYKASVQNGTADSSLLRVALSNDSGVAEVKAQLRQLGQSVDLSSLGDIDSAIAQVRAWSGNLVQQIEAQIVAAKAVHSQVDRASVQFSDQLKGIEKAERDRNIIEHDRQELDRKVARILKERQEKLPELLEAMSRTIDATEQFLEDVQQAVNKDADLNSENETAENRERQFVVAQ